MIPFAHVSSLITDASNSNGWMIGRTIVESRGKAECEITVTYPDLDGVSSSDITQFEGAAAARGYKLCHWSFSVLCYRSLNTSEKVMTFIFEQEAGNEC